MSSAPSLWWRLQLLQPTLPLLAGGGVGGGHPRSPPRHMSYSFAVVPPPVPAATSAFETHVRTLLRHVPHPTFLTCTSYSPYFDSAAAQQQQAAAAEAHSATQHALTFLDDLLPADVGLVLTITATRATCAASHDARQRQTTTSLTGATRDGTTAVLADFLQRTARPSSPQQQRRSCGLMVLRGDDGGHAWRCAAALGAEAGDDDTVTAAGPPPYAAFADGAELLKFLSASLGHRGADVCLCIGGYPQGHVLDRQWGQAVWQPPRTPSARSLLPHQTHASLQLLGDLDAVYADTEAQLRRAHGSHDAPRSRSAELCATTSKATLARLAAVRRLWTTPSVYPAERHLACTVSTIACKVRPAPPAADQDVGARVVVTQMIMSAAEFLDYVDVVRRALEAHPPATPTHATPSHSLVVVPGLMAPLRAEQFVRVVLQLKVLPSPPLQAALLAYGDAIAGAAAACTDDDGVDAYERAKEAAELSFQRTMEDATVAIVRDLRAHGYTHVNIAAWQYGCGDAIGRVVAALAADESL
ncbi:hypothetical protein NESM_000381200 [Novymonas esmeraldas]|uniref:Uncharacterized protein n=1 Tax=Novymonas esmeraldas TaxID=1808958 RepID=A0AAW0ELU2_9TRYP